MAPSMILPAHPTIPKPDGPVMVSAAAAALRSAARCARRHAAERATHVATLWVADGGRRNAWGLDLAAGVRSRTCHAGVRPRAPAPVRCAIHALSPRPGAPAATQQVCILDGWGVNVEDQVRMRAHAAKAQRARAEARATH